jgi:hypothetical protein
MSTKSLPFASHLANLEAASPNIIDACGALAERAGMLADKEGARQCPQEAVSAFDLIRKLKKVLEETEKSVGDALKAHVASGGAIESGEYALSISTQDRTTIPWKDVAAAAASALAAKEGKAFVASKWEADLKKATPATPVTVLKVVKVAGA